MVIDPQFIAQTLSTLVSCNSINPAFGVGGTDEAELAAMVEALLRGFGAETGIVEFAPGRRSVIGKLAGQGGGRSLMLYGHLDTVSAEGMTDPFVPRIEDGRLYGRGAYDMKGGLAACLAAMGAVAAGTRLEGDLYLVAVADEETESRGMLQVLETVRTDGAIVTEATELDLGVAHKGFCWIEVTTEGRAAHGSRPEEGIDANSLMGRVLVGLERQGAAIRSGRRHPLVGAGSQHVGVIQGGTGPSIYAAQCRIEVERRLLPGESGAEALGAVAALLQALATEDPDFRASCRLLLERPSFEEHPGSPLAVQVRHAATAVRGTAPAVIGHSYWMDASLLKAAGIETVVIGPAGAGAHAAIEYVELESVRQLAKILALAATQYCGTPG
jgi:acetylornithine deacetylase